MTSLKDIEQAVERLNPDELQKFRAWFEDLQERLWDQQMERDAAAGKLDALNARARANLKAGRVSDL